MFFIMSSSFTGKLFLAILALVLAHHSRPSAASNGTKPPTPRPDHSFKADQIACLVPYGEKLLLIQESKEWAILPSMFLLPGTALNPTKGLDLTGVKPQSLVEVYFAVNEQMRGNPIATCISVVDPDKQVNLVYQRSRYNGIMDSWVFNLDQNTISVESTIPPENSSAWISTSEVKHFYVGSSDAQWRFSLEKYKFTGDDEGTMEDAPGYEKNGDNLIACADGESTIYLTAKACSTPAEISAKRGMIFKDHVYLLNKEAVFVFEKTALDKPETKVKLSRINLWAFFGQSAPHTHGYTSNVTHAFASESTGTKTWIIVIIILGVLVLVTLVVGALVFRYKSPSKESSTGLKKRSGSKIGSKASSAAAVTSRPSSLRKKSKAATSPKKKPSSRRKSSTRKKKTQDKKPSSLRAGSKQARKPSTVKGKLERKGSAVKASPKAKPASGVKKSQVKLVNSRNKPHSAGNKPHTASGGHSKSLVRTTSAGPKQPTQIKVTASATKLAK